MSSSESRATARPIAAQLRPGSALDIWITNGNGVIATVNMRVSGHSQQIMDAINQRDALLAALEGLCALYLDGHPSFIACITPPCAGALTPAQRKRDRNWSAWDAARAALAIARGERAPTT